MQSSIIANTVEARDSLLSALNYNPHLLTILYDPRTNKLALGTVDRVAFSPDGALLASDSGGGLTLWNLTSHRARTLLPDDFSINSRQLLFSRDSTALLAADAAGFRRWNTSSWNPPVLFPQRSMDPVKLFAISRDGTLLATARVSEPGVQLWKVSRSGVISLGPHFRSVADPWSLRL